MPSNYSEQNIQRAILTMDSVNKAIEELQEWNKEVKAVSDYYNSSSGTQLLAADCMLITAIGEGINKVDKLLPGFLGTSFPGVPWKAIIGMRNHIAHGYFEIDAEVVFEAIFSDMPRLKSTILTAIEELQKMRGIR